MPKNNPNPEPFITLRRMIDEEEERTRQYAIKVRISQEIAGSLQAMDAFDWHEASRGWTDMEDCERLAGDFAGELGINAANGMALSIIGPWLVVAERLDAPAVEITLGRKYDRQ